MPPEEIDLARPGCQDRIVGHESFEKWGIDPGAMATGLMPEIRPGQSVELFKELHILTRDAKMNQDSRRKLKQIYHLFQFVEPLLEEVRRERGAVRLVDHGAGKSYLGFILYDLFFKEHGDASHISG